MKSHYSYKQNLILPSLPLKHIECGLTNLGNTCFMNSSLQCLYRVKELTEFILSITESKETSKTFWEREKNNLVKEYFECLRNLYSGRSNVYTPWGLKDLIGELQPKFKGYEQHDALEFITVFLDGLHNNLKTSQNENSIEFFSGKKFQTENDAAKTWENYVKENQSIVVDLFFGLSKSTIKCSKCDYASISFQPFNSLSLSPPNDIREKILAKQNKANYRYYDSDLDDKNTISIYDLFKSFSEPSCSVEGANRYCEECNDYQPFRNQVEIYKAPSILILHLKKSENVLFPNFTMRAIDNIKIDFPVRDLDIGEYVIDHTQVISDHYGQQYYGIRNRSKLLLYDLFGVVNHYGNFRGGHYTAFAKSYQSGKWYCFNDSQVNQIEEKDICTPASYILFYKRKDIYTYQFDKEIMKVPEIILEEKLRNQAKREDPKKKFREKSYVNEKIEVITEHKAEIKQSSLKITETPFRQNNKTYQIGKKFNCICNLFIFVLIYGMITTSLFHFVYSI